MAVILSAVLVSLVVLMSSAASAAIYRSVDKDGNVTFSDQKPDTSASEEVFLQEPVTIPAAPVRNFEPRALKDEPEAYSSVEITSPDNQETFHNPQKIPVTAEADMRLAENHKFQLLVDGKVFSQGPFPTFILNNPDRGEHTLEVQIVDEDNNPLISSPVVTIYVHRTSIKPARPKPGKG